MTLLRHLLSGLFAVVCLAVAVAMLLPPFLGYERYVITSGSMTGTYDTGSIVYERVVPTASLTVGDVITYAPPAGMSATQLVTHRIVELRNDEATGKLVLQTKGDANAGADPWRFSLDEPTQARVAFGVPYAGYAFAYLGDPRHRQLLIGAPAVLIALLVLLGMVREAREERRAGVLATA